MIILHAEKKYHRVRRRVSSEEDFSVVDLPAMTVASSLGFGTAPEAESIGILLEWAAMTGLTGLNERRFFGFNNPDPSPGSPNYGYEQWVTVDEDITGSSRVTVKHFSGGRYVVMDCMGYPMPEKWAKLVKWVEDSQYEMENRPCLEECLTPEYLLEPATLPDKVDEGLHFLLYLPVRT